MHKPVTMCAHRTLGNERQIAIVVVEPGENMVPYTQYAACYQCISELKNVVGVSSNEDFVFDNYTLGDANGTYITTPVKGEVIATFKTDNRAKYETIPLENITIVGETYHSGISTAINNAVAAMMTNPSTGVVSSWANWILVSCVIRIFEVPREE